MGVFSIYNLSVIAEPGTKVNLTFIANLNSNRNSSRLSISSTILFSLQNCKAG